MRFDGMGYVRTTGEAETMATQAERVGYDGWWAPETTADAFLSCAVAARATHGLELGTGIAVAFARSPMTVAIAANDLQLLSGGRFTLGLGAQIEAHITKRFSMPYGKPVSRMREFVLALRAIWSAWETGDPLDFRGEHYTFTLMPPFFNPGPNPHGPPKIVIAAVGPKMAELAGEVGDGVLCHSLTTERYLREVLMPAINRGAGRAGRTLEGFEVVVPPFVVGRDDARERASAIDAVRWQMGFYGSTPAYRPVLELHGWGPLQEELHQLTRRGEWHRLPEVIDDEVVDAFAVVGTADEAAAEVRRRFGGIATRIAMNAPDITELEQWRPVLEALRSIPAERAGS